MDKPVIIYEKNSGRPFSLTEKSARPLLNSGAFLSLNANLSYRGVNTHEQKRIHLPTERHEIKEGHVSHEMCDGRSDTGCESTEAKYHSRCSSEGQDTDLVTTKVRSRGRPKAIKVNHDEGLG